MLNGKVFFWSTESRLISFLQARSHRNRPHDVLTVCTPFAGRTARNRDNAISHQLRNRSHAYAQTGFRHVPNDSKLPLEDETRRLCGIGSRRTRSRYGTTYFVGGPVDGRDSSAKHLAAPDIDHSRGPHGSPPRVRGNPRPCRPQPQVALFTPARAGEPCRWRCNHHLRQVYPRACRGNPGQGGSEPVGDRSIPACAGEP